MAVYIVWKTDSKIDPFWDPTYCESDAQVQAAVQSKRVDEQCIVTRLMEVTTTVTYADATSMPQQIAGMLVNSSRRGKVQEEKK